MGDGRPEVLRPHVGTFDGIGVLSTKQSPDLVSSTSIEYVRLTFDQVPRGPASGVSNFSVGCEITSLRFKLTSPMEMSFDDVVTESYFLDSLRSTL